jgi:PAS domain S-box-containing protein
MSPQIETMLGFPLSSWVGQDHNFFFSRIHPDDKERVAAEVQRTHSTGDEFRLEYRMIAADGSIVWVRDQTVAVRDAEYRPLFLQGYLVDVTDRRAADEALRRSEEIYRLVVEASRDLVAVVAADGTSTYLSPAVEKLLGYRPDELVGLPFSDLVHPDDAGNVISYFENRAAGIDVIGGMSARARHKDGGWVTLEATISVMEADNGSPAQFVCVARVGQRPALRAAAS